MTSSLLFLLLACATPSTTTPLTHEAFVWQRVWTPPVREAVANHTLDGLVPLVGEVQWSDDRPHWTGTDAPPGQREVALRVAVPPAHVPLTALDPMIARVRRDHPDAALQLDLDLPTRRLDEYARWLSIHDDIIVTALPTWLDSRDFRALTRAAAGFVLQVHWVDPADPHGPLLRPDAVETVNRAAAYGRPFRVALPTYGHRVWMAGDRLIRLDSEDGEPIPGARPHVVLADPVAVDAVLDHWRHRHPEALTGVVWFRLPTDQDNLSWPTTTLEAVRSDQVAEPELRIERQGSAGETVCLHNEGNAPWLPTPIPTAGSMYSYGREGWSWSLAYQALIPPPGGFPLLPGRSTCIGRISTFGIHNDP